MSRLHPSQSLPLNLTKWTGLARKLPTPIYKKLAQAYIDYEFPKHIFIETTAHCNLSCDYCPREKRKDDMDFGLFKDIVDECSKYGARSFSFHLFGETLLYPKIIEAILYTKKQNKNHTVLITTNGTLLNKYADALLESGVDRIIWSWRKNNFTERTIQVLRKIGMVRLLIEETPKEEFEKWKTFPRVEIKHLHNYGGNIDVSRFGLDAAMPEGRYPCYHLWLAPAVRWNGELTFCCNVPQLGTEVLGCYGTDTIASVWKGEKLEEIRKEHLNKIYRGACKNCTSWQAYPSIF